MRGDDIPQEALDNTLRTYEELQKLIDSFLSGRMQTSVLIIARAGVGKSHYVRVKADPTTTHVLGGNLLPMQTYMDLYRHRGQRIVLDDGERLWGEKSGRIILRQLTEADAEKTIAWHTTAPQLQHFGVPREFPTTSQACIICNTFRCGRTDETEAIINRCHCFYFNPTNEEVVKYVATWFGDQKVLDYVQGKLHTFHHLNARSFVKAAERRLLGDSNWRKAFALVDDVDTAIQEIMANQNLVTTDERVADFERRTRMDRATFFRRFNSLEEREQLGPGIPPLKLRAKGKPPAGATLAEVVENVPALSAGTKKRFRELAKIMKQQQKQ